MLLLETAIESILIEAYNETNDIDEACKLTENDFQGIKISKELNGEYYKILVYSSINNTLMTIINNIPIKK